MEIRRAAGWSLASTGNTPAVSWGPGGAGFHIQSARQHYSRASEQHAELLQGGLCSLCCVFEALTYRYRERFPVQALSEIKHIWRETLVSRQHSQ